MTIDDTFNKISKEEGPVVLGLFFRGLLEKDIKEIVGVSISKIRKIKEKYKGFMDYSIFLWQEFWHKVTPKTLKECYTEFLNEFYKPYELTKEEIDKWEEKYYEYKIQKRK